MRQSLWMPPFGVGTLLLGSLVCAVGKAIRSAFGCHSDAIWTSFGPIFTEVATCNPHGIISEIFWDHVDRSDPKPRVKRGLLLRYS